ncbi:YbbR domain-containing protein [Clostridium tetanomorphum]|uniref:Membrane associated protein n=1 Tax=Clostridium tetanomorphum TaxID=1553 RepID=A0A923E9F9_CLOTT|nr:CdaR family protein [Clostridium tetanomorphum]KAJ52283.1 membrane associated protein [Clostridium tetanomorphum DSM 665]MBC2397566.1 hypothetical protein [Clostridium tetanomorphum]MBP1863712.1 YbbR domain-containing protein [Clostridium tetanomorphum]NRS86288.1 YbbR domain-containing protein [Clostridium tetanomorphum]NRZ95682.1 YbbR domain-containing protein [Clostridium tetanomorphum]
MDKKYKRQQIIVKICCVIASFGLWLYITSVLKPIGTYKKNIPVTIVNSEGIEQSKLTLVPDQKPYVTLTLKCTLNDIYSIKEEQFKIVADLDAYVLKMKKGENNVPVQIQKSPENITIVNSDNLFVNITLDDLIEKTVPLNVYTVGNPKEGYYSTKPSANITDVTVKGAGRFINQIHKAQVKCDISNMYRDLNITLPVQAVDVNGNIIKDVKVHPISTEVRVPIKKAKTVSINVKTTGKLNDNRVLDKITALPEKVDITGEENIINNINSLDTEVINLENVKGEEITSKLIVPKGVTLVNNNGYVKIKIASNYIINKEIPLTVKTINEDKNYSISLDKEQVTLTVSALQEEINNLKPEDIECYIDLKDLKEGQHSLQVKISLPESIKIISISPENITVNIKKKIIVEDENANKDK